MSDELNELREQILSLAERYAELQNIPAAFEPGVSSVPPGGKVLGAPEMRNLVESCLDSWLTRGRFALEFEKRLAKRVGSMVAVTTNSGSSANLLALSALTSHVMKEQALKEGDEVITCATSFPTTVNPIFQNNLVPVFVDVELGTYNPDVSKLEEALSPKTRAIMFAHALGNPFDLGVVTAFAQKYNLHLIEDCADAFGATYNDKPVGTFGAMGTLSFFPAHPITTGEGGAVLCNRMIYKRIVESLRDWGRDCYCEPGKDNSCNRRFRWRLGDLPSGFDHKNAYSHMGYNLKLTDMQASVGLAQLDRLDGFVAARAANWQALRDSMKDLEDVFVLPEATPNSVPAWMGFCLTLRDDAAFDREDLAKFLNEEKKIGTRPVFAGNLLRQPYMKDRVYRTVGEMENADRVMRRSLWISVYPGLTQDHLAYIGESLRFYVRERPVPAAA